MDVQTNTFPLFKLVDSETFNRFLDQIPTFVGAVSISAEEQPELCLSLFKNSLLLRDLSKNFHTLDLTFDIKLQILNQTQKDVTSHVIGFKLYTQSNQHISFYGQDSGLFVQALGKFLNMKGFHQMFKPIRKLGRGNFATVYQAERVTDHQRFAVKAFSKQNSYCAKNGKQSLMNELSLLKSLNIEPHPNVLRLQAIYESQNSIYVVLELLDGQTLLQNLQDRSGGLMPPNEVKKIIEGLLKGLAHLHKNRVMHRDLKPENIMIRKQTLQPVIVDFGLATNVDLPQYLFFRCGTPGYVAPQIIQLTQSIHLEPTCDVFSLGAIFHVVLMNKPLFQGTKYDEVYKNNKQFKLSLEGSSYDKIGQNAMSLIKQMLTVNPLQRITAEKALQHPYFTQMQQESMKRQSTAKTIDSPIKTETTNSIVEKKKKKKFFFF